MKKKLPKFTMPIIIILIACILLFGPGLLARRSGTAPETVEAPVFSVRTQEAARQTLYAFLDVNGDIICTQQAEVFPDVGGILVSVQANLGTYVNQGQVIAEVNPSRPGMVFLNSPVTAPISGIISRTPLSTGTTVGPQTAITTISRNENLEIFARIPEREIAGLAPGLRAEVFLQAYPGETFHATVIRVSPVVDNISRTKLINLRFDSGDRRISSGMFARVRLNTRSYPDVVTVPVEAVVSSQGGTAVFVIANDEAGLPVAARREVGIGASLQGLTEIRSGLEAGETVIVQGQQLLSGGEYLRIIGSDIFQGSR
ncbi:MAG: efflux RND transporter periplasmic adaptor subunit [Treponema sp.]|jgi:multidrug efflux pump subunit AcrA (membrane-fusion protein)|nr:efflux RND transporter periplasmic adaptor subunit [Treponema sp.]